MPESFKALSIFLFFTTLFFISIFLRDELVNPQGLALRIDPIYQGVDVKGNVNPLLSDLSFEFYPWRSFVNQWIKQGIIPFWNPTIYAGMPYVADDQSAVLYPLNILSYVLPLGWQFTFLFYGKILLACFFTFLFTHALKISFSASIVSGLVFGLSGFFTVWLGYGITNVAVFLPLALWAIRRIGGVGFRSRYSLVLALAWASQLLGGHLETFALLAPFYAVFVLYEFGFNFRKWLGILGLGVLALGITTVQWLPFLGYVGKTAIFGGRLGSRLNLLDLSFIKNLPSLITFLAPNFFGNPVNKNFWNPFQNYNEGIFYVGIIPLVLAVVAIVNFLKSRTRTTASGGAFLPDATSPQVLFWVITALVALLISLSFPPFNLLAKLPILSILDFKRYRLLLTFSIALLAGLGLDIFSKGGLSLSLQKTIAKLCLASGLFYAILLAVINWLMMVDKSWVWEKLTWAIEKFGNGSLTQTPENLYERLSSTFSPLSLRNLYPAIFLVLSFFIFWSFQRSRNRQKIWKIMLAAIVFADLAILGIRYQPTLVQSTQISEPAVVQKIKEDKSIFRVAALGQWVMTPNLSTVFGLQDVRGADIVSSDYSKFFHTFNGANQTDLYFWLNQVDHNFLNMMNVKYIIVKKNFIFEKSGFEKIGDFGGVELWENREVWPRAFEEAENALPRPLGFRKGLESGKVEINLYTPDEVSIQANVLSDKSLLVLADAYGSGWQVFVDGKKGDLLKTYEVLRAVELTKGDHLVKFVYQPWSVIWGIRISTISLGIFMLLGLLLFLLKVTTFFKGLAFIKARP